MQASIEYLNELSDRFPAAVKANRDTPGRVGSQIEIGDADAVLVVGDLHGNRANFAKAVKAAKLDKFPRRHLVMQEVVHGGPSYPSGGCMSHMLLEDVAKLKLQFPTQFHFLLCNHEAAEATGQEIHKSNFSQNMKFAQGLQLAYGPAAKHVAQLYHRFILSCPLAVRLPNGVFVSHTFPDRPQLRTFDPAVLRRAITAEDIRTGGPAYGLLWGRDYAEDHVVAFLDMVGAKLIITGHEPAADGFKRPNSRQLVFDASGQNCYICVAPVGRTYTVDDLAKNLTKL